MQHVTPFQARKRFLSSAAGGTTGLLNRPRGGVAGGRSMSYSPSPLDVKVTASLPPRMAIVSVFIHTNLFLILHG